MKKVELNSQEDSHDSKDTSHNKKHDHDHDHDHGPSFFGEKTELYFAILAGISLGLGYVISKSATTSLIPMIFYVLTYFFGGFFAVLEAFENLKQKKFAIDTLMIVAAVGAAFLGEWPEGGLLLALFSLGHSLEHYAMGRAKKAIEALAELAPKFAHVIKNGETVEVSVDQLAVGDIVLVKPNERIPVDGIIIKGSSAVNQAPVTGESVPVDKIAVTDGMATNSKTSAQHMVFAGTINGTGTLEVKVTKLSSETTLARVAKMVADAQAEASPTQEFTKKFERYFVPSVLLGVVLLLFAFLIIPETFSVSFYRAMAVLVAASPCALAISTPSAVLSGIARSGRGGVLIKGGAALENLGKVEAIAFDKTGTLTEGKPIVTDVVCLDQFDEKQFLSIAAAVESQSDHPLAAAVVNAAKFKFPTGQIPKAVNVKSITGKGIRAEVGGETVFIGKPSLFDDQLGTPALPESLKATVAKLQENGRTIMVLLKGDKYVGVIGIMDSPRKSAKDTLSQLRKLGVQRLIMLSGDNQKVAQAIAKEIGLTDAVGELMPEEKVTQIKKLRNDLKVVAMVGDGVNDAPAMASATVGIAMGAAGSEVALETADVALMTDDLAHLVFAVGLSRKASTIIKQNLWVSLGMVAILIPSTILGLGIGPAVALHEGSTIVVVFNALRLLAYRNIVS